MLFFTPMSEMKLSDTVLKMRGLGKAAADRYRRTLYIIDCPINEDDLSFATERGAYGDRWPLEISNPDKAVAIYEYHRQVRLDDE